MNDIQSATGSEAGDQDLQDLVIETFEVEELSELGVNTPMPSISACSSTCSSSCG